MAKRITITVSDELHLRLEGFRDQLNISRVCQEAIAHAVRVEEMKKLEGDPDFEKLLLRLKEEKEEIGRQFIADGFEAGKRDAFGSSIHAFMEIIYGDVSHKGMLEKMTFEEIEQMIEQKEYDQIVSTIKEHGSEMTKSMMRLPQGDPYSDIEFFLIGPEFFAKGWIKGVLHVWKEVRERI